MGRFEYFDSESATKALGGVQLSAAAKFSRTIVQGKHVLEIIGNARVLMADMERVVVVPEVQAEIAGWQDKLEAATCEYGCAAPGVCGVCDRESVAGCTQRALRPQRRSARPRPLQPQRRLPVRSPRGGLQWRSLRPHAVLAHPSPRREVRT